MERMNQEQIIALGLAAKIGAMTAEQRNKRVHDYVLKIAVTPEQAKIIERALMTFGGIQPLT